MTESARPRFVADATEEGHPIVLDTATNPATVITCRRGQADLMVEALNDLDQRGTPMADSGTPAAGTLERQYVYRQRFTLEVVWATAAPDDAFDDSLIELMGSIGAGETVIWRYHSGPVERMGGGESSDRLPDPGEARP